MDLLRNTPYLLHPEATIRVMKYAQKLGDDVALLRKGGTLDSKTLQHLRQEWSVQQVYESVGIEGNELTLSETQLAIQRGITISGKPPSHSREVQNLHAAQEYLETLAAQNTPVTEWEIRELQSLIVGKDEPEAGGYRSIEIAISNSPHIPPHPIKIPEQMADFAAWMAGAQALPVSLLAAVSHAWLVHIHPFRDGNGRTARALTNLLLIRNGYPIVIIRRKDRQRYYEALRSSDGGDISPMLELLLERSEDSLRQIDRARTSVTGISLAVQKVKEQEERRYRVWLDGLRLLGSTLESCFKEAEVNDPHFHVSFQRYDLPTVDDFREICNGSAAGNTWHFRARVTRGRNTQSILFWIGYSSDELSRELRLTQHSPHIPVLKLSVPNPSSPPPWVSPDGSFPSAAREFAYHDGQYYRVEAHEDGLRVRRFDSVLSLAGVFVAELFQGWYTDSGI